jgi:hypothetical protein
MDRVKTRLASGNEEDTTKGRISIASLSNWDGKEEGSKDRFKVSIKTKI